jgi:capsular polysaccharide biosynthesis protein
LRAYDIFLLNSDAIPDHAFAHSKAFGAKQKFPSEAAKIITDATETAVNSGPSQRRKQNIELLSTADSTKTVAVPKRAEIVVVTLKANLRLGCLFLHWTLLQRKK